MPRRIGVVTLCVSLALLLGVVASGFATGIADSVYTNDEFDFSIALPSDLADAGWRVFEGEPGVSYAVFEGPEVETITVYVEELAEPVPLEAFVEISLFIFPLIFDDWLQESSLLIEVNGMEGYEVVYTTTIIGIPTRAVEYMFVTETHSFTMSGLFLGDHGPPNLAGLIRAFFAQGGMQFQPNLVNRDLLLDAYENPGKHKDLVVRIAGYCAYFDDLSDDLKREILERSYYTS